MLTKTKLNSNYFITSIFLVKVLSFFSSSYPSFISVATSVTTNATTTSSSTAMTKQSPVSLMSGSLSYNDDVTAGSTTVVVIDNEKNKSDNDNVHNTTSNSLIKETSTITTTTSSSSLSLSLHPPSTTIPSTITYKETKEPRKYPKEQEDAGYKKILDSLTPNEKVKMIDSNLPMRHYRADKGNVPKAIERIKYAIEWREKYGVEKILKAVHGDNYMTRENITYDQEEMEQLRTIIHKENETGKIYTRGYDKQGHAILYFYPGRENTRHDANNIKHLVYQLERAIAASTKHNCEKIVIIMDFTNWNMTKCTPMSVTKETIHVLQECYVERLHKVYMTNAPLLFKTFWNMVKPFIDPVTKGKIMFCSGSGSGNKKMIEALENDLDRSVLEQCAYGTKEDLKPFDSKEYLSLPIDVVFDENQSL